MREASLAVPCPECDRAGGRIMSSFTAFTFRDGYPRRIPDKGTFWHMGKEVKQRATRMKGWEHPELAKPKPTLRPTRGETRVTREKRVGARKEARYRDRWGIDKDGFPTVKTKTPEKPKRVLPAG
jgi:hypothetical protein